MNKRAFWLGMLLSTALLASCGGGGSSVSTSSEAPSSSKEPSSSSAEQKSSFTSFDPSVCKDELIIHYHRDDGAYDDYRLWLWDHGRGGDGSEYKFTGLDDYGAVCHLPLSTWASSSWASLDIGFIVKTRGSSDEDPWNGATKDVEADRYAVLSNLIMDQAGNYPVYLWSGVSAVYKEKPASPYFVKSAQFDGFKKIQVVSGNGKIAKFELYEDGKKIEEVVPTAPFTSGTFDLSSNVSLTHGYSIKAIYEDGFEIESNVDVTKLYESDEFASLYNYEGDDLGATYAANKTVFKVWSPFAEGIKLRLYDNGTPKELSDDGDDTYLPYTMVKGEKGVWSVEVEGNLEGKYYTYAVTGVRGADVEVVDPYAKSSGINGRRGMIVDWNKTNPEGWDEFDAIHQYEQTGLVVYETHVSDVTSHPSWTGTEANRKKFLGLIEDNTSFTKGDKTVTTGFAHIRELGVNAIQLQPMFDHDNDERPGKNEFNWGYNPLNYNVIEGSYSSNPYDGYAKIREFKQVVKAFHDEGINVIMDVVYNHVGSVQGLNFDVLAPGYYFRYNAEGGLSNGSGCGNETASDHYMFSKFMRDSVSFWAKEYKLGGFRFDLMALHDLDTMKELSADLHQIDPHIAVYGEPWTGGGTTLSPSKQASQANGELYEGYAQFNDGLRDAMVKSGMKDAADLGFAYNKYKKTLTADAAAIVSGMRGFTVSTGTVEDSWKTVTYASCHDNYTLNDRILGYEYAVTSGTQAQQDKKPADFAKTTSEEREKMAMLAQAIVFTSQGTAFMLAGEEFLRSKYELTPTSLDDSDRLSYAHNSYTTTENIDGFVANALDYSRKIDHPAMFESYKELIKLKIQFGGLHLDVHKRVGDSTVDLCKPTRNSECNQFQVELSDGTKTYLIIHNGGFGEIPSVDLSGYQVLINTNPVSSSNLTGMNKFQSIVALKKA